MGIKFSGVSRAGVLEPDVVNRFSFIAGEAISQGELVAKGESDGKLYKAQASTITRMPCIGTAVSGAVANTTVYMTAIGIIKNISRTEDFGFDDAIYVSAVAGKATKNVPASVGHYVQQIGRSVNASDIMLDVDLTMLRLDQV